jgi:hypothetical protein
MDMPKARRIVAEKFMQRPDRGYPYDTSLPPVNIAVDVSMRALIMVSPLQASVRATFCNEYVDTYISCKGNRLLPNDGRNLNIFLEYKTITENY